MQKLHRVKGPPQSFWLVAIPAALAVVAMALAELTARAGVWWDVAWTSASICALAGTLRGWQATSGPARARWTLWVAACGCWLIGQLAWDLFGVIGAPSSPNVADFGWWMFAVLITLSMARRRTPSGALRAVAAAEVLPVIVAATALTFALLWHDVDNSILPVAQRLSALVYPTLYVSAAVLVLQALVGGGASSVRSLPSRLGLGGVMAQAFAFIMWSPQLLERAHHPRGAVLDLTWVLGLIAIGSAGALSVRQLEPEASAKEPGVRAGILPSCLFLLLIGALVRTRLEHASNVVAFTLYAGLLFSGGALVLRSTLLEGRLRRLLDRERAALASLADREAELARLNEQLLEDSRRDPLTGMRNRRALADELPGIEARHIESGDSLAVALCDVDHFKAYNDEQGHLAGDQALRAIANTIRGALRAQDLAYRFGGEELLLVLPGAGIDEATAAAARVRAAVEAAALPHPSGIGGVVTVSIGVAAGTKGYGGLLARADAALYEAKRGGRNRVMVAASHTGASDASGAPPEPGATVPLRSMLALSRAAASGQGVVPVLEAVAELIRSELSFQVVAVNLLDKAGESLHAVVVEGDEEARRQLLGTSSPWREWAELLASDKYVRHGALWLPAGAYEWEDESNMWTPPVAAAPHTDAWHPHDMLMLPLRTAAGEILGLVSVDQPLHGRRPDDGELDVLMAVADQAGLSVEQAQRDADGENGAREQSQELRLAAVMLLAETLDLRDASTARHSRTVGAYARHTAAALGLGPDRVERVHAAGVLHDLGKLGIADAILHKPGKLDPAEWKEIQRHPEVGARILEHAGLRDIAGWVRAHHERVDGHGYPKGLAGQDIPLEARILSVADAYEAMIADRPYRAGMPSVTAREELIRCGGTQFDPGVVEAFLGSLEVSERDLADHPVARAA
ncbi:MAG: diguanylate cyclase [Solirubrobacterales bacterium]|nr:diguanylate cyclase [Solirubrobacterales bacterium]